MKKIFSFFTIFIISLLLVSCQKEKIVLDEYGFFVSIDDAQKNAKLKHQDIIVIVTMEGDDEYSERFLRIAGSEEFRNTVTSNYSIAHFDFSQKSYKKTVVNPADARAVQRAAEKNAVLLQKNAQFANLLNVQRTPSFFLLTEDEYFVQELETSYVPSDTTQFMELIAFAQNREREIKELVSKTKNGDVNSRLNAIDDLYEFTERNMRVFLADLVEQYIKLDSKNQSGKLEKYLLADAENTSLIYFTEGNYVKAADVYVKLAERSDISAECKQTAYFTAAYFLIASGSDEASQIIQNLRYALDAAPESEMASTINQFIEIYTQAGLAE